MKLSRDGVGEDGDTSLVSNIRFLRRQHLTQSVATYECMHLRSSVARYRDLRGYLGNQ